MQSRAFFCIFDFDVHVADKDDRCTYRIEVGRPRRGAYVFLTKPEQMVLPLNSNEMALLAKFESLEKRYLVTEVVTCSSYAMGLAGPGTLSFSLAQLPDSDHASQTPQTRRR